MVAVPAVLYSGHRHIKGRDNVVADVSGSSDGAETCSPVRPSSLYSLKLVRMLLFWGMDVGTGRL